MLVIERKVTKVYRKERRTFRKTDLSGFRITPSLNNDVSFCFKSNSKWYTKLSSGPPIAARRVNGIDKLIWTNFVSTSTQGRHNSRVCMSSDLFILAFSIQTLSSFIWMASSIFLTSSQFIQSLWAEVRPVAKDLIDHYEMSNGSCNSNQRKILGKSSLSRFILPCPNSKCCKLVWSCKLFSTDIALCTLTHLCILLFHKILVDYDTPFPLVNPPRPFKLSIKLPILL